MEESNKKLTTEQLQAISEAQSFQWDTRKVPEKYDPVQLKQSKVTFPFVDWWNTRSNLLCCCFPILGCISGSTNVDAEDTAPWKEQLKYSNPDTPESMRGLWWLQDNIAHENLVTIFNDCEFTGNFNEDGTNGYGIWELSLKDNWSRDRSAFGHILLAAAVVTSNTVKGYMNLKDGILTVFSGKGKGRQVVYRIDDNEWWKVHYDGNPGENGDQDISYMYKWLKVLDKDGNKTEHWNDWVERTNASLPNPGCCCLSNEEILENMVYPNKSQVVRFKRHS